MDDDRILNFMIFMAVAAIICFLGVGIAYYDEEQYYGEYIAKITDGNYAYANTCVDGEIKYCQLVNKESGKSKVVSEFYLVKEFEKAELKGKRFNAIIGNEVFEARYCQKINSENLCEVEYKITKVDKFEEKKATEKTGGLFSWLIE